MHFFPSAPDSRPSLSAPHPPVRLPPSSPNNYAMYDCDSTSFYSHASVVDVSDLLSAFPTTVSAPAIYSPSPVHKPSPLLLPLPRPLSDRVVAATAEALDLKLSRATTMLAHLPLLSVVLTPVEFPVILWLLHAARARAAAFDATERLFIRRVSTPSRALILPPAQSPPSDALLRAVVLELRYTGVAACSGARYAAEWDMHARIKRARTKAARSVVLPLSFAVALVGIVCALVRVECEVTRRMWGGQGSRGKKRMPQTVLMAKAGRVRFGVTVVGTAPCQVLFRKPRFMGRDLMEEFEGIVEECVENVQEFAEIIVYG